MNTHNVTIDFRGVRMDVQFYFTPFVRGRYWEANGDHGCPDEPEEFYINDVTVDGEDWMEMLSQKALEEIENEIRRNDE